MNGINRTDGRTGPRVFFRRIPPILVLLATFAAAAAGISACAAMGGTPEGERLMRMHTSPNFNGSRFSNPQPTSVMKSGSMFASLREFMFPETPRTVPESPPPLFRPEPGIIGTSPARGLRATWLGHSSVLIEMNEGNVLLDPVFGHRASPVSWAGPERFHEPPLPIHDLPRLDAVVISHDHYDHLDKTTIQNLAPRVPVFVVPLGVGAHLTEWGVPEKKVVELDWGQEYSPAPGLVLACTPARHFSGRGLFDRNTTLWCGWAILSRESRVFFSGDTGMHDRFTDIGEKYGPFDLTMMDCGAYNKNWADIHMTPEQAVQAHMMVRGGLFMPVHWATFKLSPVTWTEPAGRAVHAAMRAGVDITLPRPGQPVEPGISVPRTPWWPHIAAVAAEAAVNPKTSTSVTVRHPAKQP